MLDEFKNQWQAEAKLAWKANKGGIVVGATGSGKTNLAIDLIKDFKSVPNKDFKCVVIVDSRDMYTQWKPKLEGLADLYVVNTVALKEKIYEYDFAVFDECDKYLGDKFFTVYDKIKYRWELLLTGTFYEKDKRYKKLLNRFKIIYKLPINEAIKNNIVTDVKVYNLYLPVADSELQVLKRLTREGQENLHLFDDYQQAINSINNRNLRYAIGQANSMSELEVLGKARQVETKYRQRKEFIQNHPSKINTCIQLIDKFRESKIMTFSTLNQTADTIANLTNSCVIHSKCDKNYVKEILQKFKDNEIRVINSVKKLISGIDVPDTDTAIIVNYTSSKRDLEQTVGRVIRKFKDKQFGRVIFICFGTDRNSQDFVWLKAAQANLFEIIGSKIKDVYSINEIE